MSKPKQYVVFISESEEFSDYTWCSVSIDLDEDHSFEIFVLGCHPGLHGIHIVSKADTSDRTNSWNLIQ